MKLILPNIMPGLLMVVCGVGACFATGCASPANTSHSATSLNLTEIRQSSSGELALIYNEQKAQQTGQRLYIVDQNALSRNVKIALNEIQTHPGYGETFSGAVVMHRKYANDTFGQDTFWVQLDPYQLPGAWLPALSLPPLPPGTVAQALPASFQVFTGPTPANASAPALSNVPPAYLPTTLAIAPVHPNEHFIWRSNAGPFDTAISPQPLIQRSSRRKFWDKAEDFAGGTITVLAVAAVVGAELVIDCAQDLPHTAAHRR